MYLHRFELNFDYFLPYFLINLYHYHSKSMEKQQISKSHKFDFSHLIMS